MTLRTLTRGVSAHGGPQPLLIASLLAASALLTACNSGDDDNNGPPTGPISSSIACADIVQRAPTLEGNTTITSATAITGGTLAISATQTLANLPNFCRVQGVSKPTADSTIGFEVWLPTDGWNGRFMSSGEGGFVGALNYTRNGLDGGLDEIVRRGYVTASTDTGHLASDTFWAIGHPEKVIDYGHRAKHLVTLAAKALTHTYYGRQPYKSYLNSCSNGGRQALMEVQRYPDDFDGVVAGAPWNFQSHSAAGMIWTAQALSEAGAAIPAAKLPAIQTAAVAACDATDGLADGVIEDPRKCSFDPQSLLCTGADSNSCLTAPQITALNNLYQGPKNPRTGEQIYQGWSRGGETGWTGIVTNLPASSPFNLGFGYFANLVYGNPNWDFKTFNFDSDMAFADSTVGAIGNAMETNMAAARNRGVKVILYQGWNDQTLQPGHTPNYYEQVVGAMGGITTTQQFARLFMVPGMTHCYFGPGATSFGGVGQQIPPTRDAAHDLQKALEAWVENGSAPETMVATKYTDDAAATRTVKLQRLLCSYPKVARFKPGGDPNQASGFECVAP
ncbi:MAG: tannase/feruloyl esterase family alpha/beta hydrolase [Rhizobacter sp.]|nr:tannase/feruloyl esterase family alpha/beta hydrolase [Rhizobacter sp.]